MQKKMPLRMCVVCREMKEKKDLIRLVKNKQNEIFVDSTFKAQGRGAYVCKDEKCLERCKKNRILNKVFKCEVKEGVYEGIK